MDDVIDLPMEPMDQGTDHGITSLRPTSRKSQSSGPAGSGSNDKNSRKRKASLGSTKSSSSSHGHSGGKGSSSSSSSTNKSPGGPSKKRAKVTDVATRVFRGERSSNERALEGILFGGASKQRKAESMSGGKGGKRSIKREGDGGGKNKGGSGKNNKKGKKSPSTAHSGTFDMFGHELESETVIGDTEAGANAAGGKKNDSAEPAFDTGFFGDVLVGGDDDNDNDNNGNNNVLAIGSMSGSSSSSSSSSSSALGAGSTMGTIGGEEMDMDAIVSSAAADFDDDEFEEDLGPVGLPTSSSDGYHESGENDDDDDDDDETKKKNKRTPLGLPPPAWKDSDDEKLRIDVSAVRRARKLRVDAGETVLSGVEYSARLRDHMTRMIRGPAASATEGWAALPSLAAARAAAAREAKEATRALEASTKAKVAAAFGGGNGKDGGEADSSSDSDSEIETEISRGLHLLKDQWIFGRGAALSSGTSDESSGGRSALSAILGSSNASLTLGAHQARSGGIKAGKMGVSKLADVNAGAPVPAVVQRVTFHPSASVLAAVGFDKRLRLYSVDGARSGRASAPPPLASVYLADLPIRDADWVGQGGRSILVSGRRPWAYSVDVETGTVTRIVGLAKASGEKALERVRVDGSGSMTAFFGGKTGSVVLAGNASHGWIGNLRMPRRVSDVCWAGDSTTLVASTNDGTMYEWDVRMTGRECVSQWRDVDGLKVTSIGVAPVGGFVATGTQSGVVNMYRNRGELGKSPVHVKGAMSLTTSIDGVRWSGDGQVAAVWSREVKDALRLVHGDSGTVFHDWPLSVTRLRFVSDVAWSPGNGYLAVANDQGRIGLYRMHPYSSL